MYSVTIHPEQQLMRIRMDGFWTLATMAAYTAELRRQSTALGRHGGCRRILIDMSDYPIQSREIAAAHAQALDYARESLGARAALVMRSALSRLQASRVARSTGHAFFDDEPSAMAWLTRVDA